ncbi:MAG: phenylalanine--tRNA ligase subunit beta [Flavobacteriales bacterium]|nr:phenylalanine--tRNA ligase subunit beta [Flavobacteriales bacterium]
MKISYKWLNELFDSGLNPEKTSEILTNTGLEVEGLDAFESIPGGLEGLVIGEVKEKWQHPNADRLSLTKVDVGGEELLQIVCGAPNVDAGQKVVVATVGAKLYPSEGEPFVIKKGKIRGEVSLGMICAEDEIGLGQSHDGIMVLDASAEVGTPAASYFNIENDHTIEIGLTPNRTDAISHYGVARDLRASMIHTEDIRMSNVAPISLPDVSAFSEGTENGSAIDVVALAACPRYAGVNISGVTVADSPEWLQNRLKAIGLAPINNIVDITNYVMHEIGQPLHAFDRDQIAGDKVVVRMATEGEKFVTLDGEERELSAEDLMICDTEKPMCIAGVFGGEKSGITEGTKNVFLESAVFDAVHVRKTSKRHLLHTDAAYRFERGVDPTTTIYALQRAALLIAEIAGGTISSKVNDYYPVAMEQATIEVDLNRANKLIGKEIPRERVIDILKDLDFDVNDSGDSQFNVTAPLYRKDVTREADVVEEILRIYGYNNIELPERLNSTLSYAPNPDPEKLVNKLSSAFVARGMQEIMNNSLTKLSYTEVLDLPELNASTAVRMKNPLSQDLAQMRQTLLYQGLEVISRNINFRYTDQKLFEFGRVYHVDGEGTRETPMLGIWITGKKLPESWNNAGDMVDFTDLRVAIDTLAACTGLNFSHRANEYDFFVGSLSIETKKNKLGQFGAVSSALLKKFDIDQPVYFAEIDFNALLQASAHVSVSFKEISKYPAVRRDLSMVLDQGVTFDSIEKIAFHTERKLLTEVDLFDVYEGKNIGAGKKSYAVSFTLQDPNSTLTDKKIDKTMQRIQDALSKELGAELRS